ncbi:MAG: hypothetical protein FJ200_04420 [Gemmatimonadetes bacterium]|nr:hypothetical protein [Gemmatimonadota bacterium]
MRSASVGADRRSNAVSSVAISKAMASASSPPRRVRGVVSERRSARSSAMASAPPTSATMSITRFVPPAPPAGIVTVIVWAAATSFASKRLKGRPSICTGASATRRPPLAIASGDSTNTSRSAIGDSTRNSRGSRFAGTS